MLLRSSNFHIEIVGATECIRKQMIRFLTSSLLDLTSMMYPKWGKNIQFQNLFGCFIKCLLVMYWKSWPVNNGCRHFETLCFKNYRRLSESLAIFIWPKNCTIALDDSSLYF